MNSTTNLSADRLALLQQLLRDEGLGDKVVHTIPRRRAEGPVPQSSAQQRLWFLEQLTPGTPLYTIETTLRLPFPVDVSVLERAFNEIVRRHESLRTVFRHDGGQPVQVILPELTVSLPLVDVTHFDASERQAQAAQATAEWCSNPFDLSTGPLVAATLLKLDDDDFVLVARMHHIVSDGWSVNVFLNEITALYDAYARGAPSPLPQLPIQYADYAQWEQAQSNANVFAGQLDYWKTQLANAPALQLPHDFPRPHTLSVAGATQCARLEPGAVRRLNELGRHNDATPFMTVLAGFVALLARYTGQDDIVVGTPISGRGRPELEPLIGFFTNNLVLRVDLSSDPSFTELVQRVRSIVLAAMANADLPFGKLVEALHPARETTDTPLFNVVFAFQEAGELEPHTAELEALPGTAKFDLTMSCLHSDNALTLAAEYSTDLFQQETIGRMLTHLRTLLGAAAERPHVPVSQLALLTAQERDCLLHGWQGRTVNRSHSDCAHDLVQRCAQQWPERVAVCDGSAVLSYGELNRKANGLALMLREAGVRDGSIVPLQLQRSAALVVAQLAVLKAGAAFAPLDPAAPAQRVAQVLEELGSQVMLVDAQTQPAASARCTLRLDHILPALDGPTQLEPGAASPQATAYVIYTSGSTGRPKGVRIAHRSLVNLIEWHRSAYDVTCEDRATVLASPGFDASMWEIWPYLACGAALHVVDAQARDDPEKLWALLEERAVTLAFLPTPLAEVALRQPLPARLGLRALLTGGDRLHRLPDRDLPFPVFNHYGPTENTVVSTWGIAGAGDGLEPHIGRPIDNVRAYVLDKRHQLVPPGVRGQLFLGGAGLTVGYVGTGRTDASFIASPFVSGERLYATGDLVRWRGDGNLEFVGRNDCQVKIRGHRIELGEIESVLAEHERVREAVVVAQARNASGARLVAYVASSEDHAASPQELQSFLAERLPAYMVPASFVVLDRLPVNANGKVDRDVLPEPPEPPGNRSRASYRAKSEEQVAAIWKEVLGIEDVGPYDNFFDLGGHSLLLVALQTRLREAFDRPVAIVDLFRYPSVSAFAAYLDEQQDVQQLASEARARVEKQAATQRAAASVRSRARERLEDRHGGR